MKLQRYFTTVLWDGDGPVGGEHSKEVYRAADVDALLARIREVVRMSAVSVDEVREVLDKLLIGAETVHQCPPPLSGGIMPCCGRTPFEVSADRMADDPALVTCRGRAS